jgi:hypothetical protein
MGDRMTFEARLAEAYVRYGEGAPADVDVDAVARAAIAAAHHRGLDLRSSLPVLWSPLPRPVRLAIVSGLLLALGVSLIWVAGVLLKPPPPLPSLSPLWDMSIARVNPIVVTLDDGRVLIGGGGIEGDDGVAPAVELLDPATGRTTIIEGETPSGFGTGVALADGRVLVIGFDANHTCALAFIVDTAWLMSRELPREGPCSRPPFAVQGSMAKLTDGRVLVTGGRTDVYAGAIASSAVVFDPVTEQFTPTSPMSSPRIGHALAVLRDGRVVVAGGYARPSDEPLATIEIYDPATGSFAAAGAMQAIQGATSGVTLPDGRVLLVPDAAQGVREAQPEKFHFAPRAIDPRVPIEIFDPSTGRSSVVGSIPNQVSGAYLVSDGRVLVHGWVSGRVLPSGRLGAPEVGFAWAAIVDPATGETVDLAAPRTAMSRSARLSDGRVVLVGGLEYPPLNSRGRPSGSATVAPFIDVFD